MSEPQNLRYTSTHEWVKLEGEIATVGITDHAQEELGDVALVQLPEVGRVLQTEEIFGEIESIKAVSELYAPLAGEIVAINDSLTDAPELVNNDPYNDGWMVKIHVQDVVEYAHLLSESDYDTLVKEA